MKSPYRAGRGSQRSPAFACLQESYRTSGPAFLPPAGQFNVHRIIDLYTSYTYSCILCIIRSICDTGSGNIWYQILSMYGSEYAWGAYSINCIYMCLCVCTKLRVSPSGRESVLLEEGRSPPWREAWPRVRLLTRLLAAWTAWNQNPTTIFYDQKRRGEGGGGGGGMGEGQYVEWKQKQRGRIDQFRRTKKSLTTRWAWGVWNTDTNKFEIFFSEWARTASWASIDC